MAKAKGVLPSFQLFTPARRGTSLETNRTTSRRALALIQIWASEASLPLSHVTSSLSRLTPISRRYRVAPTERARKVLADTGDDALRSHGASLDILSHGCLGFH